MDTPTKLSRTTISLHWLVAITIIFLAAAGLIMKWGEVWALYPIHKSIGVLALLIILPRVIWRLKNGWPKPETTGKTLELKLAKAVHWLLIIATLVMPLSGMLLSGASGHGFGIFGLSIVSTNHSASSPEIVVAYSESLTNIGYVIHSWAGYALVSAIILHTAGALKHHFTYKDATLKRMLAKD